MSDYATYRGWTLRWDYGEWSAVGPNYEASYEGPEDGWVGNGEVVHGKTIEDVQAEVDAYILEHPVA